MGKVFTNHELVTIALYLEGGETTSIDTEDVAVRAHQLAPLKFSWRKYPNQINIDAVRKRLWDAKRPSKGGYVVGSEKDGWRLTGSGKSFSESHFTALSTTQINQSAFSKKEEKRYTRERVRMLSSEAYKKWETNRDSTISRREAEVFLRINGYVAPKTIETKINRLKLIFGCDPALGQLICAMEQLVCERKERVKECPDPQ